MNEIDIVKYLRKIIQFSENYIKIENTSISDLCRYLDPSKYKDKNLEELVKYFIKIGIFIDDVGVYMISKEGKVLARDLLESTEIFKLIESLYKIEQDKGKGTLL